MQALTRPERPGIVRKAALIRLLSGVLLGLALVQALAAAGIVR